MFLFQNILLPVAFGIQNTLFEYVFGIAAVSSLAINIVTGVLRPVYMLGNKKMNHFGVKIAIVTNGPVV